MRANVHVFHQGKTLHAIPHLRLGSGRQSPQFCVYVFFPGISHPCRTSSYLTRAERRIWVDNVLLPAIRYTCPPDVIQYHPRSFDDVESKAYSRRRENCSGGVQNNMDMHHFLPQRYLKAIWTHMMQITAHVDLAIFRGLFLVLSAKNIKLEDRTSTFQDCRMRITNHLCTIFDWSQADLTDTWIDVGTEDTATTGSWTCLMKKQCLERWIDSAKHSGKSPLLASERFTWNLTDQAGSARFETSRSHPLRLQGIAYGQRYNINKDIFATPAKHDHALFGEPHLEGITCPSSLLDAWIVAARQYRSAGHMTACKSTKQLHRIRKAFEAMKHRIRHALESSNMTSFGAREEYRISWKLFMDVEPLGGSPHGLHRPFWAVPTVQVNEFMRWEFNRWLSAVEFVRIRGTRRDCDWQDHQRNMMMATILLRSLKASVNCHHVEKRSQMYKSKYQNRAGKWLRGLDFESAMSCDGLAWLPRDLFDWTGLHLHDEFLHCTSFTFNGMQGVFQNWRNVDEAHREYSQARELEYRLRNSTSHEHPDILHRMREMVYRHLAAQVIQLLNVVVDPNESDQRSILQLQRGHRGLSLEIVRRLTGNVPHLIQVRAGKHHLGNTYPQRVQSLFDWDDGLPRTFWDHCYYRQLTRRFYDSIAGFVSPVAAEQWRKTIGTLSLPYFWIIPNFNKHRLFARSSKTVTRPPNTRPFCSGVLAWDSYGEHNLANERHWLFGGMKYLDGYPGYLMEQVPGDAALDTIDATVRAQHTYVIDFGCEVPFVQIPHILEEGFEMCKKIFERGNRSVLAHYQVARECLAHNIGEPLCDVLLMIVLTFAHCEVTPALLVGSTQFEPGPRKDPRIFAVSLTVRMLWFLFPHHFPWTQDDGMVLCISEMTKKMGRCSRFSDLDVCELTSSIEHRGVNNRMLEKLGWVIATGGRETPRNSELRLRHTEELQGLRQELFLLMENAPEFVARIFGSDDERWVDRCTDILDVRREEVDSVDVETSRSVPE